MPFKSEAQRRYMWANLPELARKWSHKYGSKPKVSQKNIKRAAKRRLVKHGK